MDIHTRNVFIQGKGETYKKSPNDSQITYNAGQKHLNDIFQTSICKLSTAAKSIFTITETRIGKYSKQKQTSIHLVLF